MSEFDREISGGCLAPALGPESDLGRTFAIADKLCNSAGDPNEEPFRSKYKARDELLKAKVALTLCANEVALIDYRLGVISLAVEENAAAESSLDACLEVFFPGVRAVVEEKAGDETSDVVDGLHLPIPTEAPGGIIRSTPVTQAYPFEAADSLIQLGVLWSNRSCLRKSLLFLLSSVAFCQLILADGKSEEVGLREGEDFQQQGGDTKKEGNADGWGKSAKMEGLLTHAFYFLAQVYSGLGEVKQSAKYCALTLERQLDAEHHGVGQSLCFDPLEWSRNACFLANYYARLTNFRAAGQSLMAGQAVLLREVRGRRVYQEGDRECKSEGYDEKERGEEGLAEEEKGGRGDELVKERLSDVERHMAQLYILILETKHNEWMQRTDGPDAIVENNGAEDNDNDKDVLRFSSLKCGELPLSDPQKLSCSFDDARELFKKIKIHTDVALKYYVMDGFVSDHVSLVTGMSRAYQYLASFEDDIKRKQAMQVRRAQALEPLLKALGVKAYTHLHKELSFELGKIYEDLADLKTLR
ncbi:unnamed protein product [Choristocarpus tenellus]